MTTASIQRNLSKARTGISKESYAIQKKMNFEDLLNEILDEILELRNRLNGMSASMLSIVDSLEKLTWMVENPTEEALQEINVILDICRGVYSKVSKMRDKLQGTKIIEICPDAAQNLFDDIDLLEETIDDVDAVYFRLPHNREFNEICQKFSELK